jgi:hypothetical protein
MKKKLHRGRETSWVLVITFLSFLCATSTLPAEKAEDSVAFRLHKLHYVNASGESGVTTFKYDDNGVMYGARWELLDGSRYSDNYHTLNKNSNMIWKYREFSDGLTSSVVYEYDADGHLTREDFSRSDGTTGTTRYYYDENGIRTKAECEGLNGWFFGTISYQQDENGRSTGAILEKDSTNIGTITYTYDDNDNLSVEHWDFSEQWSQTFNYEYEEYSAIPRRDFSSSNVFITNTGQYRLIREFYSYSGSDPAPSFFEYDEDGKLIKKIYEVPGKIRTVTTYEYNDDGTLRGSLRSFSTGLTASFEYEFNGNRKLVRRTFKRSDGVSGVEDYEYDGMGLLTKAVYDNFDTWLSGTITFEHDSLGNLLKGHCKGNNVSDASIIFEHDENSNIVRIHWEFTTSETQTYTFEYEKIEL